MKAIEEIVKRCAEDENDMLGFSAQALLEFVPFEQAKPLLKPEATAESYGESKPLTREAVIAEMRDYMSRVGWDKVEGHRGISASRTITKMEAWIWLLDEPEFLAEVESADYAQYGAPKLALICQWYGFPIPEDHGVQNVIAGRPCCDGCDEGCGQ